MNDDPHCKATFAQGMVRRAPTRAGVLAAAAKMAAIGAVSPLVWRHIGGVPVAFKLESLQPVGAFKLRGAWHRLSAMSSAERARGVVAFSSGNHAQAIAWAARRLDVAATIVMPHDAPLAKRAATLALGATVIGYDRATESREAIAGKLASERGATLVPSFDDPWVIEGQGSAGIEAAAQMGNAPAVIVTPCGGGGLAAGLALACPDTAIVTVEPAGWDDMAASLRAGAIVPVVQPAPVTPCDALMTTRVAEATFAILCWRASGVAVDEAATRAAMRWAFSELRCVVEPGGAVAIAALLSGQVEIVPDTLVIVSGGNVDAATFAAMIAP